MAASPISSMTPIAPDFSGTGAPTAYTGATSPNFSTNPATGPLSSLYATTGFTPYYYPKDLSSSTKNHYVKFWIKEIKGAGYDPTGQTLTLFGDSGLHLIPAMTDSKAVISLYMPDTLTATYNASYDELSLMHDLGKIQGLQTINSVFNLGSDLAKGNITGNDKTAWLALQAKVAGGLADSPNVGDVFLQGGGITINPQLQMIYRGVGFREFQLTFNFTPTSADESNQVNAIISQFKYHFAPELVQMANAKSVSMFMVPPSIFDIEFMFGSTENVYLPKYGDCVLLNIDVNYAPNGFASFNNGAPVQTQLNLTFREIEIVTKKKLQAGYNDANSINAGALR
ncbi:hypothetical protein UFOVP250_21 [uncultured Caudovirales phage]|uniref:Baseplate tail tube cap n=1 Tax=uncultured Caudovirales phage TaxID=2100421 RepID=A0A6J5LFN9_9CAUD|nr:hypothetical protein UFOVP250_21 [uncultured Caudovirales phage]